MASICDDPGGFRRLTFFDASGKRRCIHLGKMPRRVAEAVKLRVEKLVSAQIAGCTMDDETARWVANLDAKLARKLAKFGLIAQRNGTTSDVLTLGAFFDQYIEGRTDTKPRTQDRLRLSARYLVEYFGADRPLGSVTPGDAEEYRRHLIGRGFADNTVRRQCGRAKQFFRFAMRKRLIPENPFGDMTGLSVRENRERDFFVTPEMAEKILDACPDAQWRLLFALARYGGLRVPSEPLALRWSDVDWARQRLRITCVKTEHHDGKGSRWIPIFPELRPHLDAVWEQAEPGGEFVITRYRDTNANLRTQLRRIIIRAGLEPWPKLFQNCRASRETELADEFGLTAACAWIGNSQPVAIKHYVQVTDEHFERALRGREPASEKAAQKTAQQATESGGNVRKAAPLHNEKGPGFSRAYTALRSSAQMSTYPLRDSNPRSSG